VGDTDVAVASKALGDLLQAYWQPLYVFARRAGSSPHDAEDAVQGFCESVIRRGSLRNAGPGMGRLRTFLLAGLQNYMRNEYRDENRQKRGGGLAVISLEEMEAALVTLPLDHDSPDKAFDRRWACTLMERARSQLHLEYQQKNRDEMFTRLEPALAWNGSEVSYPDIAQKLSMTTGAVQQAVKRMRQRFRKLLEQEISETVDGPEAMAEERDHLIRILSEG